MKVVKFLLIGIVGLLALLALIGLLLPGHVRVGRSTVIAAPPGHVMGYLDGYRRFNDWSPWAELDPATKYSYSGPERGAGAHMEWHSDDPKVGAGKMDVLAIEGDRQARWNLEFVGQGTAEVTFELVPEDNGTRVTWNMDMEMGPNPIARWFGLMMDGAIGPDFERGLGRLKALTEKEVPAAAPPVSQVDCAPSTFSRPAAGCCRQVGSARLLRLPGHALRCIAQLARVETLRCR